MNRVILPVLLFAAVFMSVPSIFGNRNTQAIPNASPEEVATTPGAKNSSTDNSARLSAKI